MNFIEEIIDRLGKSADRPVLREVRDGSIVSATGRDLLSMIASARAHLRRAGLKKGDRCALLANNCIRWAAADLALMAEGVIVVPLYARQAPNELAGMMRDSGPSMIVCGDDSLKGAIQSAWPEAPPVKLLDELFAENGGSTAEPPVQLDDADAIKIIYTSGTSGEPKGVVLSVGNVTFMLPCTNSRLDTLMGERDTPDHVFHYLPFCFAGSWILMLTCLTRQSVLTLSTDLNKLVDELKLAAPEYFLNVPALLERVRSGVDDSLKKKGGLGLFLYERGKRAWFARDGSGSGAPGGLWLSLANAIVFPAIRKNIGPNLKALICGSAPLSRETQLYFMMLGIPVLQVYGLTETTAICTMDKPFHVTPGRVGHAIPGIEMKLGDNDEILVRGPNIFAGYWNKPSATADTIPEGWLHTGDQGEVDESGNWNVVGRIKNLIIPASGHNVAPEPLEQQVQAGLPGAVQVLLVGNGKSHLAAIITGPVEPAHAEAALERLNRLLPHYKRIRAFHISADPFSIENGLLTANGKFKRDVIASHYRSEIEAMYQSEQA